MKGKVWKRIRGSENKNWGKKTSFSNVIPPLVTGLVFIVCACVRERERDMSASLKSFYNLTKQQKLNYSFFIMCIRFYYINML